MRQVLSVIYVVAFLDLLAASLITTLLSNYLKESVGLSATWSGIVGSIYGFVQFFAEPIAGAECDVRGYRTVLLACTFFCIPAYALLCIKWIPFIILSRFLAGAFKHNQNLSKSVIGAFIPQSEQLKVFGQINAMGNVGYIVGPTISGFLSHHVSFEMVFLLAALMFFVNFLILWAKFPNDLTPKETQKEKKSRSLIKDFKQVDWSRHWDLFATRFLLSASVLIYRSNLSWNLKENFGVDQKFIGYLTSYQGIVSFVTSFYANSVAARFANKIQFYQYSSLLMIFALIWVIFVPNIWFFAIGIGIFSTSTSLMRPVSYDLATERCSKNEIGLLMGLGASVVSGARSISPAIGGILHDRNPIGPGLAAIFCAVFAFFITRFWTGKMQENFKVKRE